MTDPPAEPPFEHYFAARPRVPSRRRELRFLYRGEVLAFETDRGVFGAEGLDPGTALLIEALNVGSTDRVLDLGCGWGAVGIAAAKAASEGQVVLTDVNHRAIVLARANVRRNHIANAAVRPVSGFDRLDDERFDVIATNPPYHVGRDVILGLLGEVPRHLTPRGRLLMVGKGSHGIRFYQDWLTAHWAERVEVVVRGGGYRVLDARPKVASLHP
ncbi:MAG: class I SAM-dependent methyltransferase [Thermoplasmata archaeon]